MNAKDKKDSTINKPDDLKDATIKKVGKFTVIENHKPIKSPKIEGGANDTVPPIRNNSNKYNESFTQIKGDPNDPVLPK